MVSNTALKQCRRCPYVYPATAGYFQRDADRPDGLSTLCKHCRKWQRMQYDNSLAQKPKARARAREWKQRNKERVRETRRRWATANMEHLREYEKQNKAARYRTWSRSYQKHRAHRLAQSAAWREQHPERQRELSYRWRETHHDSYKEAQAARNAVYRAVTAGRLTRPQSCPRCLRTTQIQAHHHKGYAKEFWLEVLWLCAFCHKQAEHPSPTQIRKLASLRTILPEPTLSLMQA